jgi:protein gp37
MGEQSKIEWTDHTFNPWIGCSKVSPACDHCYAERIGHRLQVTWGHDGERRRTKTWGDPVRWHNGAKKKAREGWTYRPRVFCGSLCDVFEADPRLLGWREELWELVERTDRLTWLLLTKRPQNILQSVPASWCDERWPAHVWVGTTVENQPMAERRLPYLCAVPAPVLFVSGEPLLGPLDLTRVQFTPHTIMNVLEGVGYDRRSTKRDLPSAECRPVRWLIAGGESGPKARPMYPNWARQLRDDCERSDTPFFFKQWGEYAVKDDPDTLADVFVVPDGRCYSPAMYDKLLPAPVAMMVRVGKKRAGKLLDGREWTQCPGGSE